LCTHGIQKSRCVKCFHGGLKPSGLCKHGREKWRPCRECDNKGSSGSICLPRHSFVDIRSGICDIVRQMSALKPNFQCSFGIEFCQQATVAFPVLTAGIDSAPAQQLLVILVKGLPFQFPGMTPATSAAFMSGMRAIMARNNTNLPPVSYFRTFQARTPMTDSRPTQPVDFNGVTFMMDVSGRDRMEQTTVDDRRACFSICCIMFTLQCAIGTCFYGLRFGSRLPRRNPKP
jgi:hypothetical protein